MIQVEMQCRTHGDRGPIYDVFLDGEPIVTGSRDPEHDAARALLERGFDGPFQTATNGQVRMKFRSIKYAAKFRITESDAGGLKRLRWHPFPREHRDR